MGEIKQDGNKIVINFDESRLTPAQVRLIKTLNALLLHNMTTPNEAEFFETCAEMMKVCAGMINQASFSTGAPGDIPYAKQAIEYSIDVLQEQVDDDKVTRLDN